MTYVPAFLQSYMENMLQRHILTFLREWKKLSVQIIKLMTSENIGVHIVKGQM